jgi:hypothetical protein
MRYTYFYGCTYITECTQVPSQLLIENLVDVSIFYMFYFHNFSLSKLIY